MKECTNTALYSVFTHTRVWYCVCLIDLYDDNSPREGEEMTERIMRKKRMRVLIVRGPGIERSFVHAIEQYGSRVDIVSNTQDVLSILTIIPYDVVVLNNVDAAETILKVRSNTEIQQQPVLLHLGSPDDCHDPLESFKAGADGFTADKLCLQSLLTCTGVDKRYPSDSSYCDMLEA